MGKLARSVIGLTKKRREKKMDEEAKTIRFKKDHVLKFGSREVRFRKDDTIEIGEGQDISEKEAIALIRKGVCLPGLQHSAAVQNRFEK
jgi:hypothetical protein